MTMTKIPSRKTWYAYGHGPLIFLFQTFQGFRALDGPIRANRFADSRESPDSREWFQGSRPEPPFFANRASGG